MIRHSALPPLVYKYYIQLNVKIKSKIKIKSFSDGPRKCRVLSK